MRVSSSISSRWATGRQRLSSHATTTVRGHDFRTCFYGQMGRGRVHGLAVTDGGSDAPRCRLGFPEFQHDFASIRNSGLELLLHCAATAGDIGAESSDYILPHQANGRMDAILATPLGVARERIVVTADRLGNTGSAAIWLALAQLRPTLRTGQTVLVLGAEATDFMFGGFRYYHA